MKKERIDQGDIPTVKLPGLETGKAQISIGISSIIGTRKSQQDTVFAQTTEQGAIGVVCDGMGGLNSGEVASKTAAQMLAEDFFAAEAALEDLPGFLEIEAKKIDEAVYNLKDEEGRALDSGTTLVTAVITGGQLYWLSVGDSQLYLLRGNEIVAVNRQHNYRLALDQQKNSGQISQEYYEEQMAQGDALISFIGMGDVSLMDINRTPFALQPGDMVLLCSDGLYRRLSEEMTLQIVQACLPDLDRAAHCLTTCALDVSEGPQDNTSVVLMRYDA